MKKTSLIFTISMILWSASPLFAQVILPTFISDNMVLHQQTNAPLWGKAKSGTIIKLTCSWDNSKYETKTNADGKWNLSIKTPKACL
ncbi:MAG: sialate O-acetylesterase [Halieaceae bacterium]|jgi:sialate O-acetylesterase